MRLEWKMQESYISLLTDIIANVADVDTVIGPDGVTDELLVTLSLTPV